MTEPLIVLDKLKKVYTRGRFSRTPTFTLEADLTIDKPAIVGVVGPNGAGKTTLFEMMTGSNEPTGGHVYRRRHRYPSREISRARPARDPLSSVLSGPPFPQGGAVSSCSPPRPPNKPMVHLFDEPQFNPQDGYIGFMLDFFRKLRAEGRLVFVCLHPTASYHLEILSEIAERFLLVSNGGVTPHPTFKSLIGDERCQDLSRAGDDPRRRNAGMSGFGNGQVALVTGAAGSMGLATASMLAAEGYRVAMADLARQQAPCRRDRHRRSRARLWLRRVRSRRRLKQPSKQSKASSARSTC